MTSVIASAVSSDREQAGGYRHVRYSYTLMDNYGAYHELTSGVVVMEAGKNSAEAAESTASARMTALAGNEIAVIISNLERGKNLLRDDAGNSVPPRWAGFNETVYRILNHFLPHPDPTVGAKVAPLVGLVSDDQITACGFDPVAVRALAADWADTEAKISAYVPMAAN